MGWAEDWAQAVKPIRSDLGYEESARQLRQLLKTGLLKLTDLKENPERFFLAHRLLAMHATSLGPGFWIRFTVQYNLFAGTVLALGNEEQVSSLAQMQAAGLLGCFGLTEKLAGVNSGLVVNTTATYEHDTQTFRLSSPDVGSHKNWISQGLVADKSVVIADLRVNGKSHGPHGFLIDFRVDGKVVPGIELGDMGRKTVGNDLDNAWIAFDCRVPRSCLLCRYTEVDASGNYVQKKKGIRTMEMIGQRLFTGRVAVAQAALTFARQLYASTRKFADEKACWAPKGQRPALGSIPQLKHLFVEADQALGRVERFAAVCEAQLCKCLRADAIPPTPLCDAIAVAKVRCVETAIPLCFRLKQEVGSYALMGDTGFEQTDFLQCCKFAEGDSRVLMQKMARDRVKQQVSSAPEEEEICVQLRSGGPQKWDDNWEQVYRLAELVMDRTMTQWVDSKL